ncbi:uncharacterized protein YhfF [Stackebrandtia albiflava]|uniref:Uncharacterized protein YhfF n=1 Tax=Stackebrandtia albiflava TaxID=406432 RepID=A0A562V510_9ACTN|nr:ASCH domain-containing protein [Stackebrandtia albiflava]TWJ12984.1 uncharacterized protein YhfF [Stackebrandtia albiflava]
MWPRVNGLRALELGTPGELREELTALVLAGEKTATAGLLAEYETESEALETVGEHLALLATGERHVATVEITRVEQVRFDEVTWEFAAAEGEGYESVAHWRESHARFWRDIGTPVDDDTTVVCLWFRVC